MWRTLTLLLALSLVLASCRRGEVVSGRPRAAASPELTAELTKWRSDREGRLKKADGWLTLVGLFWLDPGKNSFGSAKTNKIVMPAKAPVALGTLVLQDGKVTLQPDRSAGMTIDGKPVASTVELQPDTTKGGPTRVQVGPMHFIVVKRGDRYGIRVRDPENEARAKFTGLDYYPPEPRWRIEARLEPYNPPKKIPITNIVGITTDMHAPGALVFEVDGKTYRLDPISEEGSGELFVIFKDTTSRDTTYPAGRYLDTKSPGPDGKVTLDFNKAYNPPCVFTPFATCPLPPQQNVLPIRIEAGEKNYDAGHA